jgi:Plasmid pRiA4b ORF-3-like protein
VLVVRGTKKLRDRVKAPVAATADKSTTVLGDWFGTALFWKPQVALLVNQRTFVPVFMPLAPAASLLDRAPTAIAGVLRRLGADDSFIEAELDAMAEARIAPTNDRSVVGVMNEFAFHGEIRWHEGMSTLADLAVDLAGMPLGPLRDRSGFPDRELAALLGIEYAGRQRLRLVGGGASTPTAAASGVFQLKVTLKGKKPPIWRRVLVDASSTLGQLHEVIQAAFGWWNYHLYEFEFGRIRYGIPDPDGFDVGPPTRDARTARVGDVAGAGSSFTYTYDFGDNWEHKITVERALDTPPVPTLPACIDGRRAGPPEDCGGVWGYAELLAILADPSHPEHAERAEWAANWGGTGLDPDAFDPSEFAGNLHSLHLATFDD